MPPARTWASGTDVLQTKQVAPVLLTVPSAAFPSFPVLTSNRTVFALASTTGSTHVGQPFCPLPHCPLELALLQEKPGQRTRTRSLLTKDIEGHDTADPWDARTAAAEGAPRDQARGTPWMRWQRSDRPAWCPTSPDRGWLQGYFFIPLRTGSM
jgi:hypothetical protein